MSEELCYGLFNVKTFEKNGFSVQLVLIFFTLENPSLSLGGGVGEFLGIPRFLGGERRGISRL